ncbi:hypothetical protein K5I29_03720 [Flavobacterium agricola]|uniref:Alpha-L-arabinofuranosidase n=1 Tax=Flavobacterium agricola TaxID=2870839 RepID=A0ABY6M0E7_9FLAO|nr:hypothetical protein [Flavobacterium agricola]UYW02028.1 hypothetical protein K5I29_03720 [Flavobacterium agricola]
MYNTLAAGIYSLLDQSTYLPKPNYWAALLWSKLMGTEVYEAGKGEPGVYLFAHNTKNTNNSLTLLVINTNEKEIELNLSENAKQFTLTSDKLEGTEVFLNGNKLAITEADELPEIIGKDVKKGIVKIPAYSLSFFTLPK